jgi:hypothetical protein
VNFLRRVQPILSIGISVLVLLICVGAIAGVWIVGGKIASAAVTVLGAVDESAQAMRNGVNRVDTGLARLGDSIGTVEEASGQLAQNVSDKGLLLILLPPTREEELTTTLQSVQRNFIAIQDLLEATSGMLLALDSIPFVDTPGKGLAKIQALQEGMNEVSTQVEVLKTDIGDFRLGVAANVSRITTATTRLTNRLEWIRSELALVDSDLNAIQVQSRRLQELSPILLVLNSIFVTLMALWVGYSQVVMIDLSMKHYRETRNHEAMVDPDETGESFLDD